ncbi:hypothetical protein AAVH_19367 [Aphelenchoides avenae]|nr:hypothetical protein AAVH_19367 [Aphelenchus avenae]
MDTYRHLQIGVSVFLVANTIFLYLNKPDWWICGWLSGLAGLLNVINRPGCQYWRFASALVVVLGTLETLFLYWSVRHVEQAALIENSHAIVEGRNILLAAIATTLTVSTRIRSAQHDGLITYLRTLLLAVSLVGLVPALGYATCFYVRGLPYCHAFH